MFMFRIMQLIDWIMKGHDIYEIISLQLDTSKVIRTKTIA